MRRTLLRRHPKPQIGDLIWVWPETPIADRAEDVATERRKLHRVERARIVDSLGRARQIELRGGRLVWIPAWGARTYC